MQIWTYITILATGCLIRLFESDDTPPEISLTLHSLLLTSFTSATLVISYVEKPTALENFGQDLALDFLYREDWSWALREAVGEGEYVRLWTEGGLVTGEDFERPYLEAFTAYVSGLGLQSMHIVSTTEYLSLVQALQRQWPHLYHSSSALSTAISLHSAMDFVGKILKPAAFLHLGIFTDSETADNLLQALEAKRLNKPGYVYIVSQTASLYRYHCEMTGLRANGVLFVGESALIAQSRSEYLLEIMRNQVQRLLFSYENSIIRGKIVLSAPQFDLFSLHNALPNPSTLYFPGNITHLPTQYRPEIAISANYDLFDTYNPELNTGNKRMRGLKIALDEVNSRYDLVPNYYLVNNSVNYIGTSLDNNTTRLEMEGNQDSIGILHLAQPISQRIIGLIELLKQENSPIPILSSTVTCELSDSGTYPLYLRPRASNSFLATVTLRLLRSLQWREIAVIYTKDVGDSQDFYARMCTYSHLYSVDIVNGEDNRGLPEVLTEDTKTAINATLADIKRLNTRIIVIFVDYYPQILTQMYDLDMTGYLLVFLSDVFVASFDEEKVRTVSQGAFVLSPRLFLGEIGTQLQRKVETIDGEGYIPSTCLYYDLAYLYFYAVDYLLQRGMDYEDPGVLVQAMRETHFVGCSGFFKILKGSNDRDESLIDIYNFQVDTNNHSYRLTKVGLVDSYGASPTLIHTIQWPDLQPSFPYQKPLYLDCPYAQTSVVPALTSKSIAFMIYITLVGLTICTVGLIWRHWQTFSPPALSQKHPLSFEDVLVFLSIVLDYFQYISLGPDVSGLISSIWSTSLTLTLSEFVNLTNGVYWVVLNSVIIVTAIWTILCLFLFGGVLLSGKCKKCLMNFSGIYWMPMVSNTLFLTIVSTLANVYQCSYGLSTNLTDSFMDKDCRTFCWQGRHFQYVLGSATLFLVYIPVSLITRPMWQELQPNLHIKAYPTTLLVKAVVQVVLLGLAAMLRTTYPGLHGYIYTGIITLLLVYMMTNRQFNYSRVNMWQILQMVGSLTISIFALIQPNTTRLILICTLFSLYFLFICVGIGLQCCVKKYRSQLFRQKSKDIRGLLEFAFTKGKRAEVALQSYYQTNNLSTTEQNFLPISTSHQLLT